MADHREVLYTIDTKGRRKWVYPAWVEGYFTNRRRIVAYALIVFYLSLPWLTIKGKQAVLLDIFNRKFTFFGTTFWATDTVVLLLVLLILGLSLFFFTSVLGRVWCGWACPETVFLEFVFRPIERLIEGGPVQRERLDKAAWNFEKVTKKLAKHGLCAVFSWILASTALAYFYGRDPLIAMMQTPPWENWYPFLLTLGMMGVMAFQFGWFREQFCTVLCPYARFQSVLMDTHSLGVGYDPLRGEPRGKPNQEGVGDCIDCGLCVRVCPTGIDIRNGNQLECIHCTACIDACDSIMKKVGREPGLIRYDTEHRFLSGETEKRKVSLRTVLYGTGLFVLFSAFGYVVTTRSPSEVKVVRGAFDAPYHQLDDGRISNHVHLRISNRGEVPRKYTAESKDARFELVLPVDPYPVAADSIVTVPLFVLFNPGVLKKGKVTTKIFVADDNGYQREVELALLGPG